MSEEVKEPPKEVCEAREEGPELKKLREEVEKLKAEAEGFKSKFYYVAAELDNARKRFEREKENIIKYGLETVMEDLIDVVDNLERTITAVSNGDEKMKQVKVGMDMVTKQFLDILKKNGLEQLKSVGTIFDPNLHEAMSHQPAPDKQELEVLTEYQKGYVLNGRLLRAAKVVVAKNENNE